MTNTENTKPTTTAAEDAAEYARLLGFNTDIQAENLEGLARAVEALDAASLVIYNRVGDARLYGATWAQIGDILGISRQAAQQRYAGHWF